jgi:hypothetical protein
MLKEGMQEEELKDLVSERILVDVFEPKYGEESNVVVIAFEVGYEQPAKDLGNFLEQGSFDLLDVDVSSAPNNNENYYVFVELYRNSKLFEKVNSMLVNMQNLVSRKPSEYLFRSYRHNFLEWTEENFSTVTVTNPIEYVKMRRLVSETVEDKAIKKRLKFLVNY